MNVWDASWLAVGRPSNPKYEQNDYWGCYATLVCPNSGCGKKKKKFFFFFFFSPPFFFKRGGPKKKTPPKANMVYDLVVRAFVHAELCCVQSGFVDKTERGRPLGDIPASFS